MVPPAAVNADRSAEILERSERARLQLARGEVDEAISILEDITLEVPDSAITYVHLGIALRSRANLIDARNAFRKAIELQPGLVDAHHGLGSVLLTMGSLEEALRHLHDAAELDPHNAAVQNEMGNALVSLRRTEEATAAFERAASLRTDWSVPWHNMAVIALHDGDRERAIELLRRSTAIGSPSSTSHLELGMQLLIRGEFHEGWREYEWRWRNGGKPPQKPELLVPVWDGTPLGERTLLLWHEQGFGDVLQFVRFAALIPREQGKVVLHAPARLASVLATCPGIDRVVVDGETLDIDVQYPVMSLPLLFDVVPAPQPPYLSAPAECRDAEEAIEPGTALNVGLVWASGRLYPAHGSRDCPLELFAPLADIPGVRLFSLQYGDAAAELEESPLPIVDLSSILGDFHKTAAFVKRLDLIISVDTSLVHLAGALGAPIWTLVSGWPDWRWGLEGDRSRWYESMRLYRQQTHGDWKPVIERIAHDLRALVGDRFAAAPLPKRAAAPKKAVPEPRIFIKQYGERGTGTNSVRATILANYEDTEVLMHILGDSHAPPVPLDELRRDAESQPDPAWSFVSGATFAAPAASTQTSNRDQLEEMRRLARGITGAFDRGELRYAITIKDPYAWAVSLARADRWILGTMELPPHFAEPLAKACRRFNRVYAEWFGLADAHPRHSCVVRYEDLVRDSGAVFGAIEGQFGLQRRAPHWQEIGGAVQPAPWDGWPVSTSETLFDRRYSLERRYLARIPPEHRQIIAETIDWPLFSRFGYGPLDA